MSEALVLPSRPDIFTAYELRNLFQVDHQDWDDGFLRRTEGEGENETVRKVSLWDDRSLPLVKENFPDVGEEAWEEMLTDHRLLRLVFLRQVAKEEERRHARGSQGDGDRIQGGSQGGHQEMY